MAQKIHPVAVRLGHNRLFDASWYSQQYRTSFRNELLLRRAIESLFTILSNSIPNLFLGRIFYQQSHQKIIITLFLFQKRLQKKRRSRFLFKYSSKNTNATVLNRNKHSFQKVQGFQEIQANHLNLKKRETLAKFHRFFLNPSTLNQFQFVQPISNLSNGSGLRGQNNLFTGQALHSSIFRLAYATFLRENQKEGVLPMRPSKTNISKTFLTELPTSQIKRSIPCPFQDVSSRKRQFFQSQQMHPFFDHLEKALSSFFRENVYLQPIICRKPHFSAIFLAEQIVQILKKNQKKKKVPYRLIKKLIIGHPSIGIRIQCSGRLGGVEMAKKFLIKKGQTSLNTFSQKVDFAQRTVLTKYGIIGIKVWAGFSNN